jgi:hypothetical protein
VWLALNPWAAPLVWRGDAVYAASEALAVAAKRQTMGKFTPKQEDKAPIRIPFAGRSGYSCLVLFMFESMEPCGGAD